MHYIVLKKNKKINYSLIRIHGIKVYWLAFNYSYLFYIEHINKNISIIYRFENKY